MGSGDTSKNGQSIPKMGWAYQNVTQNLMG